MLGVKSNTLMIYFCIAMSLLEVVPPILHNQYPKLTLFDLVTKLYFLAD